MAAWLNSRNILLIIVILLTGLYFQLQSYISRIHVFSFPNNKHASRAAKEWEPDDAFIEDFKGKLTNRRRRIYAACASRNLTEFNNYYKKIEDLGRLNLSQTFFSETVIDNVNKFMITTFPASGSEILKQVVIYTAHSAHFLSNQNLSRAHLALPSLLALTSKDSLLKALQTYIKVAVVINPLDRILSGWHAMSTQCSTTKFNGVCKQIIAKFRVNASKEEIEDGYPVTFNEFLQYLDIGFKEGSHGEKVWMLASKFVPVCDIPYEFILHFENLEVETKAIVKMLTGLWLPSFPPDKTKVVYPSELMMNAPRDVLQRVLDAYKVDFEIFGYEMTSLMGKY